MKFHQTTSLDFPAADTTLGTTVIQIEARAGVSRLSIAFSDAIPAAGVIRVMVLKDAGNPATAADYVLLETLTAPGTIELVLGQTIRIVGFSGTGTGTVAVTVSAD